MCKIRQKVQNRKKTFFSFSRKNAKFRSLTTLGVPKTDSTGEFRILETLSEFSHVFLNFFSHDNDDFLTKNRFFKNHIFREKSENSDLRGLCECENRILQPNSEFWRHFQNFDTCFWLHYHEKSDFSRNPLHLSPNPKKVKPFQTYYWSEKVDG